MPPLHVLFADDDSDETYLFNEAIEHAGVNVVLSYAIDGNSLLSFLKHNSKPDVVVIDINMPYKDGLEALTEIRRMPEFDKLPLIMYSTLKGEKIIEESYQKGASMFVVKPNNFDGMVQVVKKIFAIDWNNYLLSSKGQFLLNDD